MGLWRVSVSEGDSYDTCNGSPHVHSANIYARTPDPANQSPVTWQCWHGGHPLSMETWQEMRINMCLNIFFFCYRQYMNTAMQGTYIPQYTHVPPSSVTVEVWQQKKQSNYTCQSFCFPLLTLISCPTGNQWTTAAPGDIYRTHKLLLSTQQMKLIVSVRSRDVRSYLQKS